MTAMKSSAHRPSDPFLGVTVLDDYRVVAHLRAEPRGDTYRALPQHTGTPVQVKLLAQSLPRDTTARATWARVWGQAERMPRLDHPNVERVLDCGLVRVDGAERFCVVTELLDGESLQAHVHARGRFAVDEVLTIGQQVAQGLAAAHRVGLVHGDLRATNVTLVGHASNDGSDARVVLCDLGLTNLLLAGLGSSHTLGEMLCSPESIAPEQIRGEPTTPATDVYAFGVVLYRLLTGLSPFHADNTTQMLRAHLTRPVPQMRDRCHALEVPPVLEALVRRCLAKRQEDRPQSIDTLLAGLQECEATVLSMSAPGTPSWVTPRNAASLPARARAEADRPARILVEASQTSSPLSEHLTIDVLPEDGTPTLLLPTARGILPARTPSASDTPALTEATVAALTPAPAQHPSTPHGLDAPSPVPTTPTVVVSSVTPAAPSAPPDAPAVIDPAPIAPAAASAAAPEVSPPPVAPPARPAPHRAAPLALAAAAATLAAVYSLVARHPRPPAPASSPVVALPAPATPAAPPATATVHLEVRSNTPQPTLSLRGRTYPLPIEIEIEPGREQEMIELSAQGHMTRRMWLVLDRTMRLQLDLDAAPAPDAPTPAAARRGAVPPRPAAVLPARLAAARLAAARLAAARAGATRPAVDPVQQFIQARLGDVAPCVQTARAAGVASGTRLFVRIVLKPSGRVRTASAQPSSDAEGAAGRCIESAIRRWTFPPPRTPEAAEIVQPFTL